MERGLSHDVTGTHVGYSGGKIGFLGATPVARQSNLAAIAITYTTGDPSITPDGAVTIADGATPTVDELLELCEELVARVNAMNAQIQNLGLQASS